MSKIIDILFKVVGQVISLLVVPVAFIASFIYYFFRYMLTKNE